MEVDFSGFLLRLTSHFKEVNLHRQLLLVIFFQKRESRKKCHWGGGYTEREQISRFVEKYKEKRETTIHFLSSVDLERGVKILFFFFFNIYLRERECVSKGRGRGGERESSSGLQAERAQHRTRSQDSEVMI